MLNTASHLQIECLWFAFSGILKHEFDGVKAHCNSHYICCSRHYTIASKPDVLYYLRETVEPLKLIKPVTEEQLQDMTQQCEEAPEDVDNVYHEYFKYVTDNELRVPLPSSWNDAFQLYQQLLAIAE